MGTPRTAILAGGESSRMGRDKARLKRDGSTLLGRTVRRARSAGSRVLVVGRRRADLPADVDAECIPDERPGLGPIGGLRTALHATETRVLLVACDMPLLTTEAFTWALAPPSEEAPDGVVTVRDGEVEPLFSLYFPSVLSVVDEQIEADQLALRELVAAGRFLRRPIPDEHAGELRNVNTPEQWKDLEASGG